MQSFIARITPLSGNYVDNSLPGPQPPAGAHPSHPIYIPVEPPPDSGLQPEHPIYIPVFPAHPIVIPLPPSSGLPSHPIYIPPYTPPVDPGYGYPETPVDPGYGVDAGLRPEHPIYIPIVPPDGAHPEHPIYFPVEPTHPIVLPPDGGTPRPPPAMVSPPTSQPGFWGYSYYYKSFVFVPFEGVGPGNERPQVNPLASR